MAPPHHTNVANGSARGFDDYRHVPLTQVCPAAHALPHEPQSAFDVCRLAQTPLQSTVPVGQAQLLLMHTRLPAQICPQKPQLVLSFCRFTHALPHLARPCAQLTLHAPFEHTSPPMQRLPHEPQLRGSLLVSTHAIPHCISPDGHAQLPAVQVEPMGHVLPQEPQSRLFVWRSTHAPLGGQDVCPVGQPIVHAPFTHWLPGPHRFPQVPQLRGSVVVSTQNPPQLVVPAAHWHALETQLAPGAHALPHLPQSYGSLVRSTHAPLQLVSPVAHVSVHVPSEHTSPEGHTLLHEPQLFGSPCVFVHTPLQRWPPL
jgi:hypothetical protein